MLRIQGEGEADMGQDRDADEVELGFWRMVLRRRRVLIAAIVTASVVVVLGAILLRPPTVTATAEVYVGPTDPRSETAFLTSNVVRSEVATALGREPVVDVTGSEGSPILQVTAVGASAEAAVAELTTYLDTYVALRAEAAGRERGNASEELGKSLSEVYELLALPELRPELRTILERERLAYEEAIGAALADSVLIPTARPIVLAAPTTSGGGGPDLVLYGLGAALIGFVAAMAVAAVVERLDPRVGRGGVAAGALGAPLLGTVPGARVPPRPTLLWRRLRGRPPETPVLAPSGSRAADAVSLLRNRLRARDEDKLRIVQVAAAGRRDVAHSVRLALELAESCARVGTRAVLVVADYRDELVLPESLDVPPEGPGLAAVLAGTAPVHDVLARPSSTPDLQVLMPGPAPDSVVDELGGPAFGLALTELSLSADVVLVLSPPLLAHPDGLVVGEAVDATLVVASRDSQRRELELAREQLDTVGARVAGVVFAGPEQA